MFKSENIVSSLRLNKSENKEYTKVGLQQLSSK